MKMRKLQISDYQVKVVNKDGEQEEMPYMVKDSICAVIFHPELKLDSRQALKTGELADKIEKETSEFIMLTEDEFARIERAFNILKGVKRNDLELVRRVNECEEVEVKVTEEKS